MDGAETKLFSDAFLAQLKSLVATYYTIYPRIPPRDIFFESLVEQAFLRCGWPKDQIVLSAPNSPPHDMTVGGVRLSIKSETGKGTKAKFIRITQLCTTETGVWDSPSLIRHARSYLDRYEAILMLRAVWASGVIHNQLLDVPLAILRLIASASADPVGQRAGRRSLAVDLLENGEKLFRV